MIPLRVTGVKGNFLTKLNARKVAWASTPAVGARLQVPSPSLDWVFMHEYGAAPFPIDPVNGDLLRFPIGTELIETGHVNHPGFRATRAVYQTLPEIRSKLKEIFQGVTPQMLDAPKALAVSVFGFVQNVVKPAVVEAIRASLPGLRAMEPSKGRLKGETAGDVFDRESEVLDIGE